MDIGSFSRYIIGSVDRMVAMEMLRSGQSLGISG